MPARDSDGVAACRKCGLTWMPEGAIEGVQAAGVMSVDLWDFITRTAQTRPAETTAEELDGYRKPSTVRSGCPVCSASLRDHWESGARLRVCKDRHGLFIGLKDVRSWSKRLVQQWRSPIGTGGPSTMLLIVLVFAVVLLVLLLER